MLQLLGVATAFVVVVAFHLIVISLLFSYTRLYETTDTNISNTKMRRGDRIASIVYSDPKLQIINSL